MRASTLLLTAPGRSSYCISTALKSPTTIDWPGRPSKYAPSSYQMRGA